MPSSGRGSRRARPSPYRRCPGLLTKLVGSVPGIIRCIIHFGNSVLCEVSAVQRGGKLLHKDITETRFSQVSASSLLRGGWENQASRLMQLLGLRPRGWVGQSGPEFAEHRFEHRSVPDCHRLMVTTPVSFVTCPSSYFPRGRKEAQRGKVNCPRSRSPIYFYLFDVATRKI